MTEGGCYGNDIRRATLERVGLSVLRVVHTSALTEFFLDHIREIMTVIEAKPVRVSPASTSVVWFVPFVATWIRSARFHIGSKRNAGRLERNGMPNRTVI